MIRGFFKLVSPTEIRGWALDFGRPTEPLEIEVISNNRIIGRTTANIFRPDLVDAGITNPSCGFVFNATDSLTLATQTTYVHCKSADGLDIHLNQVPSITTMSALDGSRSPVFVVGSPRSGTSALVDVLTAIGYNGYREGNYLSLIDGALKLVDLHFSAFGTPDPRVMIQHIDKRELKTKILEAITSPVITLNTATPWFDKTGNPAMIRSLPHVAQIWPGSAFIFAKRRALENLVSRLRKFPDKSFEFHCKDWTENMTAWREIKTVLPPEKYLEVDQQDMIRSPKETAAVLATFLLLGPDTEGAIERVLRSNRPQETEAGSSSRVMTLHDSGWNDEQVAIFMKHCGKEMELWGYSLHETYRLRQQDFPAPQHSRH